MATVELLAEAGMGRASSEYLAAEELADLFRRELRTDESGKVLVVCSVKCYGGEVKDFDVVAFGHFSPPIKRPIRSRAKNLKTGEVEPVSVRTVEIASFCACIEVKSHDPAGVRFQGPQAQVKYGAKWHDASNQSDKQGQALRGFLEEAIGWRPSPYIANLLWFRGLVTEDIPDGPYNFLPSQFSLATLLEKIAAQALPLHLTDRREYFLLKCTKSTIDEAEGHLRRALTYFADVRKLIGALTRQKLERITKTALLKEQQYAKSLGERLVVVQGRAGTGKTIKLLHIAHDLATRQNQRCLILTYNRALVSDIRRLVALAGVDSGVGSNALAVSTVHAFLLGLMDGLGVEKAEFEHLPFGEMYEARKNRLWDYLRSTVVSRADICDLMKTRHEEAAWDYILIDEGQDWPENERQILFSIFEPKQFVIADGVDQFVRSQNKTAWTAGVDYHRPIVPEKRSLRQKGNLVRFQELFASEGGIDWDLLPNRETPGGKIIICEHDYNRELHRELFDECKQNGNGAYEMLFLVPPALTTKNGTGEPQFSLASKWLTEWNIHIWDGTKSSLRLSYPTKVEEHRLFQYDSCRGLEGWVVVCLWLDEFVSYKTQMAGRANDAQGQASLALRSAEEEARSFAHRWAMMPLTRAIDTLVITIRDPSSPTSVLLRRIAEQCPDFVEWRRVQPAVQAESQMRAGKTGPPERIGAGSTPVVDQLVSTAPRAIIPSPPRVASGSRPISSASVGSECPSIAALAPAGPTGPIRPMPRQPSSSRPMNSPRPGTILLRPASVASTPGLPATVRSAVVVPAPLDAKAPGKPLPGHPPPRPVVLPNPEILARLQGSHTPDVPAEKKIPKADNHLEVPPSGTNKRRRRRNR